MHPRFRSLGIFACFAGLALAPAALAQSKATPTVTLRIKSIEGLLNDAKFLAKEIGKENEASQFEQLIQSQIGPKGLFGIDTKKPFGLYGKVAADVQSSTSVFLLPIADQDALLKQLEVFNIQTKKDADGTYSLQGLPLPVPVFFKFANQYLYLTALTKDGLSAANMLQPAQVLPEADKSFLSLVLNLDQIPEAAKKSAQQQFENAIRQEKDKKVDKETEAQRKLRFQIVDTVAQQLTAALRDGKKAEFTLNVDQTSKQLTADGSLSASAGTPLAKSLDELGRSKSLFGGLVKRDAAASILIHLALPESIRQVLAPAIDEQIRKDVEKEKDAAKRALAQQVLEAIKPSLKAGELDALLQVNGPESGKTYELLVAAKIREGAKVGDAIRSVLNSLPEKEKAMVKLDAEKVGSVSIHRLDAQSHYDAQAKRILGDNPIYFAVLPEAFLIAGGPKALEAIKSAATPQGKEAPQFQLNLSMKKLAPLMAQDTNGPAIQAAADSVLKGGTDDQVEITVRSGKELKGHAVMKTQVLRFVAEVGEKSKK